MQPLLQRVEEAIARHRLLAKREHVLVAVSGGVDSMVLLHVLRALAQAHGWKLTVAHFNHRLRGRAANADEKFVKRTAAKWQLQFESSSADVKEFASRGKISIEMAARKLRHEFLAATARWLGLSRIVLAHHADDQVELLLLRLLRGAGTHGLSGMRWQAPSPADSRITLVRPLLHLPKGDLLEFARQNRIPFREDASNETTDILRNRLRHELLPLLRREYQPGIDAVILRTADLLREDADYIAQEAERWLGAADKNFDGLPVALQRRVLQAQLLRQNVAADFELIEKLRVAAGEWLMIAPGMRCRRTAQGDVEFAEAPRASTFCLDELVVRVRAGSGRESRREEPEPGRHTGKHKPPEGGSDNAGWPGSVTFGGRTIHWKLVNSRRLPQPRPSHESFDADAVGETIVLRHWRVGDRFQPIGLASPAKLQDLFVNNKVPRERRNKALVATTIDGEIFWVEGLRIGERFKLTNATRCRLDWMWRTL